MVRKFFNLSQRRRRLIIEALLLSFFAWVKDFSKLKSIKPLGIEGDRDLILLKDISWAIKVISKRVPWNCVCRHQALMAILLCKRYGQGLEVFVGFRKDPLSGRIDGHSWTMAGDLFISGKCVVSEYQIQVIR